MSDDQDDCELCEGAGEVEAYDKRGERQTVPCPTCISREWAEERARNAPKGYTREPVTVLGPDDKPNAAQRQVYQAVKRQMGDAVAAIMRESEADCVTAHTLLFQQIGIALCCLDLDAADQFMDAMRRNLRAGMEGDRSGVALDELAIAGQRLEDAFELHTRNAGKA